MTVNKCYNCYYSGENIGYMPSTGENAKEFATPIFNALISLMEMDTVSCLAISENCFPSMKQGGLVVTFLVVSI